MTPANLPVSTRGRGKQNHSTYLHEHREKRNTTRQTTCMNMEKRDIQSQRTRMNMEKKKKLSNIPHEQREERNTQSTYLHEHGKEINTQSRTCMNMENREILSHVPA